MTLELQKEEGKMYLSTMFKKVYISRVSEEKYSDSILDYSVLYYNWATFIY